MKILKNLSYILFIAALNLIVISCTQDEIEKLTLACKFNSGALYTDTFRFNENKSEVSRTSDNRSTTPTSYNSRNTDGGHILSGTYYKTDINGNKTLIQDKDMWILTKNAPTNPTSFKNDYWEWELYYYDEFETDPVRFLSCYEK